ncbi:hypothetical protein AMTRI_Chr01g108720 [Amborella trichopoda]
MDESGGNCRANNLEEILRPFYQRAREAEVRLARLEAEYKNKKGDSSSDRDELLRNIAHLEAKLEAFQTEQLIKQEKVLFFYFVSQSYCCFSSFSFISPQIQIPIVLIGYEGAPKTCRGKH